MTTGAFTPSTEFAQPMPFKPKTTPIAASLRSEWFRMTPNYIVSGISGNFDFQARSLEMNRFTSASVSATSVPRRLHFILKPPRAR
jgi:hypothetical protein